LPLGGGLDAPAKGAPSLRPRRGFGKENWWCRAAWLGGPRQSAGGRRQTIHSHKEKSPDLLPGRARSPAWPKERREPSSGVARLDAARHRSRFIVPIPRGGEIRVGAFWLERLFPFMVQGAPCNEMTVGSFTGHGSKTMGAP
jgi:hypothetical protein